MKKLLTCDGRPPPLFYRLILGLGMNFIFFFSLVVVVFSFCPGCNSSALTTQVPASLSPRSITTAITTTKNKNRKRSWRKIQMWIKKKRKWTKPTDKKKEKDFFILFSYFITRQADNRKRLDGEQSKCWCVFTEKKKKNNNSIEEEGKKERRNVCEAVKGMTIKRREMTVVKGRAEFNQMARGGRSVGVREFWNE